MTKISSISDMVSWETWDEYKSKEWFVIAAAAGFVLIWSWLFARAPVFSILRGYHSLATIMLIWAIFAIGFNILLGQLGLLSFGHAMFWGCGAYAAGLFGVYVHGDPILMILVGMFVVVLLGGIVGVISIRLHSVYFAIITLLFAQFLFFMAEVPLSGITGGENGLHVLQIEPIFGVIDLNMVLPGVLGSLVYNLNYVFIGTVFVGVIAFVQRFRKSPYGLILTAIKNNEERSQFVGLNIWRYKFVCFLISGVISGVAGSLFVIQTNFVPLDSLYWFTSGEVIIMTVLGGIGTLLGPVIGAFIYLYLENVIQGFDIIGAYWLIILAFVFTVIIWAFPDGLMGLLKRIGSRVRSFTGK